MDGEKKQKIVLPFWLQIAGILSLGVIASLVIWLAAGANRVAQQAEATIPRPTYSNEIHTVTFAFGDGTVIDQCEVKDGGSVMPPVLETNDVFRGWSQPLREVTNDKEVHPIIYTIVEPNLFYFHSQYVFEGEQFSLPVFLGGTVNVSAAELALSYDPEVLEFIEVKEGILQVTMTEPGELLLRLQGNDILTEPMQLTELVFRTKGEYILSTEITLSTRGATVERKGEVVPADHATINNKTYYLQEESQ